MLAAYPIPYLVSLITHYTLDLKQFLDAYRITIAFESQYVLFLSFN